MCFVVQLANLDDFVAHRKMNIKRFAGVISDAFQLAFKFICNVPSFHNMPQQCVIWNKDIKTWYTQWQKSQPNSQAMIYKLLRLLWSKNHFLFSLRFWKLKGVARGGGGGPGVPVTPLCKPFFTQTTYSIQVAKTRVPSVWHSVTPPLKIPGYAHEASSLKTDWQNFELSFFNPQAFYF